jgi:hypothetical protein
MLLVCTNVCRDIVWASNILDEIDKGRQEALGTSMTLTAHSLDKKLVKSAPMLYATDGNFDRITSLPSLSTSPTKNTDEVIGYIPSNSKEFACNGHRCSSVTFGEVANFRRHYIAQHATRREYSSYLRRHLRFNYVGSYPYNTTDIPLPQWFRPECPPGEWFDLPDLKNQWRHQYEPFLVFGFRTERWDHQVGYEELAFNHRGHACDVSGRERFAALKSQVPERQTPRPQIGTSTARSRRRPYVDSLAIRMRHIHFKPAGYWYCRDCARRRPKLVFGRICTHIPLKHRFQRRLGCLPPFDIAMPLPSFLLVSQQTIGR